MNKLIGLDFDNTIVSYDKAFYLVALSKNLIPKSLKKKKVNVKEYLQGKDKENEWIKLQGEVYGKYMHKANFFPGFIKALNKLSKNYKFCIVSHRTKYPYKGKKINLHNAAKKWIKNKNLCDLVSIDKKNIFFLESKKEKIDKIKDLKCDIFIDDLENILIKLPKNLKKIHFTFKNDNKNIIMMKRWSEIHQILKN